MSGYDLGYPTSYAFSCQGCNKTQAPKHMAREFGKCRHCAHDSWSVDLTFEPNSSDDGAELALKWGLAIGISALSGTIHVPKNNDNSENSPRYLFDNVSAKEAHEICDSDDFKSSLLFFAVRRIEAESKAHRESIKERGGECSHCGMLFVASPGKPFTLEGYCSSLCRARGEKNNPKIPQAREPGESTTSPTAVRSNPNMRTIECPCGEAFDVQKMFVGTKRPCPSCGQKSMVEG